MARKRPNRKPPAKLIDPEADARLDALAKKVLDMECGPISYSEWARRLAGDLCEADDAAHYTANCRYRYDELHNIPQPVICPYCQGTSGANCLICNGIGMYEA